jgi:hypothetical protein
MILKSVLVSREPLSLPRPLERAPSPDPEDRHVRHCRGRGEKDKTKAAHLYGRALCPGNATASRMMPGTQDRRGVHEAASKFA